MREVGRTGRAHGLRGDVYVDLLTDRLDRLAVGAKLRVGPGRWVTVQRATRQPRRWLVHFDGIDDRVAAEAVAQQPLFAEPFPAEEASDEELWVHDLVGARVEEVDGTARGICTAVVANPADDLLELDSGSLVPVRFVVECTRGVVRIDPPTGLFDL